MDKNIHTLPSKGKNEGDDGLYHEAQDAFAHLEALMARLPEMQEKGATLNHAREARRLLELLEHLQTLEREVAAYQRIYGAALAAAQKAIERGDDATVARERGIARGYAELIATRAAPLQRARKAFGEGVESGPFASDGLEGQLEDAALEDTAFAALEREITDYQQDFQETYALCEALDAES